MKRFPFTLLLVAALAAGALAVPRPAQAGPALQIIQYNTPTPQPDGRILYTVKEGDTCTGIALKNQITEEQLRNLNLEKLQGNGCVDNLFPGDQLLLGVVEAQPTATVGPAPTPTSVLPSPTPFNGTGKVCILLFDDANGDSFRQEEETSIAEGAVSFSDRLGKVSHTGVTTSGVDPICFEDIPEGDYNITVAVPGGYNPTTVMNYALVLKAGDQSVLDFGAQKASEVPAVVVPGEQPTSGGSRSPLLGILGILVLVAGIGLGVYATFLRRRG